MDPKPISVKLNFFKELRYEYTDYQYFYDIESIDPNDASIEFSYKIVHIDQEKDEVVLFLHNLTTYQEVEDEDDDRVELYHIDCLSSFTVKDIKEYLVIKENDTAGLDVNVFAIILGVAYSTLRGHVFARNQGSLLNDFLLPIIFPLNFIKDRLPEGSTHYFEEEE